MQAQDGFAWVSRQVFHYAHINLLSNLQTVITPHVYPPSITRATFLGTSLWEQCRTSFGYLQTTGYCPPGGGGCIRFPIVVGEVGSAFETSEDKQWLQDFADFVNAEVCVCARAARWCSVEW